MLYFHLIQLNSNSSSNDKKRRTVYNPVETSGKGCSDAGCSNATFISQFCQDALGGTKWEVARLVFSNGIRGSLDALQPRIEYERH